MTSSPDRTHMAYPKPSSLSRQRLDNIGLMSKNAAWYNDVGNWATKKWDQAGDWLNQGWNKFKGFYNAATFANEHPEMTKSLMGVVNWWNNMDPAMKAALVGTLAVGGTHLLLSRPRNGQSIASRLLDSAVVGGLGGVGAYGLQQAGFLDSAKQWLTDNRTGDASAQSNAKNTGDATAASTGR